MPEKLPQGRRRPLPERTEPPPPLPTFYSKNAPADGRSVGSLMDRRAKPAFKQRGSIVYTSGPKVLDLKGKKTAEAVSATKQRDHRGNMLNGNASSENSVSDTFSIFSSSTIKEEDFTRDREELMMLREQLDDLHQELSKKDEALKLAEESRSQMGTVYVTLDELRRNVAERESLLMSTSSHLSNAEIRLEERTAAVEKLEGEARTASKRVQQLRCDMQSVEFEKFAFMLLLQELSKENSVICGEDNITSFQKFNQDPEMDNLTDSVLEKMEEARVAYIAALDVMKENPCAESLDAIAEARLKLEAFVF